MSRSTGGLLKIVLLIVLAPFFVVFLGIIGAGTGLGGDVVYVAIAIWAIYYFGNKVTARLSK